MSHWEVRYHPNQWTRTQGAVNGKVVEIEEQECWRQIGDNEYIHVVLRRPATGFHRHVYIAEAFLKRDLQPNGRWREAHHLASTRLALVADSTVQPSVAPEPPPVPDAAACHLARTKYAVPSGEPKPREERRYTLRALTKG